MEFKLGLCLVCLLTVVSANDNETVADYVNLINKETARAFSYPLPTDSSAFKPTSEHVSVYGTFDYVIVGAGSAGAVIASRLSEVKENQVLLLEAGGDETTFSDIPGMMPYLQGLEFNWNYNTTPQSTSCLGMFNKECATPAGRGLGGSSIINFLLYVRGNKRDYDKWRDQGNPGWAYEDILPFFKKSEDSHIDGDPEYHGKGGYLHVEYGDVKSLQFDLFIEANQELGRKVVDYNGKEQLGVARIQRNNIKGRRDSTGKAFLVPALNRPNLKILTHSLATKVLTTPLTKKAYAVLFSHGCQLLKVRARKEVIVSAGFIGSPRLLMLSGIGPQKHLEELNIPVVQPLPVGEVFQDQSGYFALNFVTNYTQTFESLEEQVEDYLKGSGPLTLTDNSGSVGFLQTRLETTPGYPDIELVISSSTDGGELVQKVNHYDNETYNTIWVPINPQRTFSIAVILLHPKSRGSITLKSNNPYDYPLIDSRFLSDPGGRDIETLYYGIQLALEIIDTKAFKKLNATLMYAPHPVCRHHDYLSKDYWYCQLRQLAFGLNHPAGTCKMGPDPHKGAVVSHELKVHGVRRLRVADGSIIPECISGHTNAAAIMIGEKLSHMIRRGG